MVQTFDFGSIEEMDPSVGKLFRSRYIGALCALFVRQQRGDRPTLLLEKDSLHVFTSYAKVRYTECMIRTADKLTACFTPTSWKSAFSKLASHTYSYRGGLVLPHFLQVRVFSYE